MFYHSQLWWAESCINFIRFERKVKSLNDSRGLIVDVKWCILVHITATLMTLISIRFVTNNKSTASLTYEMSYLFLLFTFNFPLGLFNRRSTRQIGCDLFWRFHITAIFDKSSFRFCLPLLEEKAMKFQCVFPVPLTKWLSYVEVISQPVLMSGVRKKKLSELVWNSSKKLREMRVEFCSCGSTHKVVGICGGLSNHITASFDEWISTNLFFYITYTYCDLIILLKLTSRLHNHVVETSQNLIKVGAYMVFQSQFKYI